MKKVLMDKKEICEILPHRDPMLMVDNVLEMTPMKKIKTSYLANPKSDFFIGHFVEEPVLPGVLTIECMAQAASIILLEQERYRGKIGYFTNVNDMKFIRKVVPNDLLIIETEVLEFVEEKGIGTFVARAFVNEKLVAEGNITLIVR